MQISSGIVMPIIWIVNKRSSWILFVELPKDLPKPVFLCFQVRLYSQTLRNDDNMMPLMVKDVQSRPVVREHAYFD